MDLRELLLVMNVPNAAGYITITDDNEIRKFDGEIQGTARNLLSTLDHKIKNMEIGTIRQDVRVNTFPVLRVHLKED